MIRESVRFVLVATRKRKAYNDTYVRLSRLESSTKLIKDKTKKQSKDETLVRSRIYLLVPFPAINANSPTNTSGERVKETTIVAMFTRVNVTSLHEREFTRRLRVGSLRAARLYAVSGAKRKKNNKKITSLIARILLYRGRCITDRRYIFPVNYALRIYLVVSFSATSANSLMNSNGERVKET